MVPKLYEVFQYVFKLGCLIVVVCMITFWFKKYLKDEDVCLVDYVEINNRSNIEPPVLSLCFVDPFIDENLEKFGVDSNQYLKHLKADPFTINLTKIEYTNVTFNLEQYYISTRVKDENGEDSAIDAEIHPSFNGFWYEPFIKCVSVDSKKLNMPGVKYVTHVFHLELHGYLKQNYSTTHILLL